jgi:murein DD-endopeptidase MepM/ murein hydrolase activator NlpD
MPTSPYIYPFPKGTPVTQLFGQNPGGNNPRGGHTGIDFGVSVGTPIWAGCDGVIEFEGWVTGPYYENPWWFLPSDMTIVLNAGVGKPSLTYGHLNETLVNHGQYVKKGQVIGYSGNTGVSTGPHCHFEYLPDNWDYQNGTYGRLDPQDICVYWDGKPDKVDVLSIPATTSTLWAIDTSLYQGDVDFAAVNADYGLVRATEGAGIIDPWMEASVRKIRNAGKKLGLYHYAHPMHLSGNTPEAEARYFIDHVQHLYRRGDKIILDWENRYSQLGAGWWALAWADQVVTELDADPDDVIFYTYANVLTENNAGLAVYRNKYPKLWLAAYFTEELNTWGDPEPVYGPPPVPPGWDLWGWQYTQYGRVPGYAGDLDLSIIYGEDMALSDEDINRLVHALMVKPIGDAYNGEKGKPLVTVSDLFVKAWQSDMEGVEFGRPAGNGFLVLEAVKDVAEKVAALPAQIPAPAPVLADKYRIELVKETE